MDATRAWNRDDGVAARDIDVTGRIHSLFFWFVLTVHETLLKFQGLSSAEVIARAHNIGSISKHRWVKSHAPEHGEHFGRMSTAAQDNKDVGGTILWPEFRDISVLGDCKSVEKDLFELVD